MTEVTWTMTHRAGLHARPLAKFVKLIKQYDAEVQVWNLTRGNGPAAGDSPIKLMLLAVSQGHEMRISADGPEEVEVIAALTDLLQNNFGE